MLFRVDEKLRATERMQHSHEFEAVFARGRCFRTRHLRIHFLRTDRELSRLGLVVSRRVGKAHDRVRVKRLLREVFRRHKPLLSGTMDVVLVPQGKPQGHREYLEAFLEFTAKTARGQPVAAVASGKAD